MKLTHFFVSLISVLCFSTINVQAEQYSTGSHTVLTSQGRVTVNVGHVSHFNAHDFFVYSFMFRPAGSKEWHQVPRVDKEDDPNMLFTIQTVHSAEQTLFDAKVIADKRKIQLITANMETGETLADPGPVTLNTYELVKLEDYERWVFLRKSTKAFTAKPRISCGLPTTAASTTAACSINMLSTSKGPIL